MRIYLDTCCFNRPFDDQTQDRIRLESEAVRLILQHVERGNLKLIGSEMLQYEIAQIPDDQRRHFVSLLMSDFSDEICISPGVLKKAEQLESSGFDAFDGIHLACASQGRVSVFLTVDDRLCRMAKTAYNILGISVMNPLFWIRTWEDKEK